METKEDEVKEPLSISENVGGAFEARAIDGNENLKDLTEAYKASKEAELNIKKLESEVDKQIKEAELNMKQYELDAEMKRKEAELKARELDIEEKKLELDTAKHNEDVKQNKRGFWKELCVVALGAGIYGLFSLDLQKKDQDFQREGFGYDNESSKRATSMLDRFKLPNVFNKK